MAFLEGVRGYTFGPDGTTTRTMTYTFTGVASLVHAGGQRGVKGSGVKGRGVKGRGVKGRGVKGRE